MRFLTINLKCLSARENRKAQFKPKEALKRTKEMALRKSLSWICFLRGKSEFANLPLSLALYLLVSLSAHSPTRTHMLFWARRHNTQTHTQSRVRSINIYAHHCILLLRIRCVSLPLSHSLSLYISLSLSLFLTFRWHPLYCKIYANKSK